MKNIIKLTLVVAFFAVSFSSCETTAPVEEMNVEDQQAHGNDAVVRKKPGS